MKEKEVIGPLIALSKTLDQAKALMVFIDAIMQKTNFDRRIYFNLARSLNRHRMWRSAIHWAFKVSNFQIMLPSKKANKFFYKICKPVSGHVFSLKNLHRLPKTLPLLHALSATPLNSTLNTCTQPEHDLFNSFSCFRSKTSIGSRYI